MNIKANTLQQVGFNDIKSLLHINTPYGKEYLNNLGPFNSNDVSECNYSLDLVEAFIKVLKDNNLDSIYNKLSQIKDIIFTIKEGIGGKVLDNVDFYEIKLQAYLMYRLYEEFNPLHEVNELKLFNTYEIVEYLSDDIITTDFYIYNKYSDKLKRIREEKREIENKYFKASSVEKEKLKLKRTELIQLEADEELNVRIKLSNELKENLKELYKNTEIIALVDFNLTKAKLALDYNGVKPKVSTILNIQNMFHPVIKSYVENKDRTYMPISLELNEGATLITGANMGGKSASLKTLLLNVILMHYGFYVFSDYAEIPLFESISYVANDLDSIENGLSSFGAELMAINEIFESLKDKKCLVVLDELARGTNPQEGRKFVRAFIKYVSHLKSFSVIATHYDNVASQSVNHYQVIGLNEDRISNASQIDKYMDYRLKKVRHDEAIPMQARTIAKLLKLDEEFLDILDSTYREDYNGQ